MANVAAQPVAKKKGSSRIPLTYVVALIPVAAALNIVGGQINTVLKLPTFLDMIGTAVVAIVLGPWWGALVGAITNIVASFISGPIGLPFAVVNVAGALVWGYGVRNLMMGKSFTLYFVLNLIVALVCTLFAVPIYVFIFGGATGHFSDMMTAAFLAAGQNLITSVFSSNIIVSLADKVISGFVALAIIEALPKNLTSKLVLPVSTTMNKVLWILGGVLVGVVFALIFIALQPK